MLDFIPLDLTRERMFRRTCRCSPLVNLPAKCSSRFFTSPKQG